jgi:hypothetical protein
MCMYRILIALKKRNFIDHKKKTDPARKGTPSIYLLILFLSLRLLRIDIGSPTESGQLGQRLTPGFKQALNARGQCLQLLDNCIVEVVHVSAKIRNLLEDLGVCVTIALLLDLVAPHAGHLRVADAANRYVTYAAGLLAVAALERKRLFVGHK